MVLMDLQDLDGQSLVLESLASPVSAINNPEAEWQEEVSHAGGSSWRVWVLVLETPPEPIIALDPRILNSHGPY